MADVFSKEMRSLLMARIRDRNTKPEMAVRRYLHAHGLRFRLHAQNLAGKPDIIFPSRKIAIFVHGCFWHQHPGCLKAKLPQTRSDFWKTKLERNAHRDAEVQVKLREAGWLPLVIWECEIGDESLNALEKAIRDKPITGIAV